MAVTIDSESSSLLQAVPRIAAVRATVEEELGAPLTKVFATFNDIPFGAASIPQDYEATLLDGRHITAKVQRPDQINCPITC